jgi:hypothetical protein
MPEESISTGMTKVDAVFGAEYVGSPETYFGASRNEFLANGKPGYSRRGYTQ